MEMAMSAKIKEAKNLIMAIVVAPLDLVNLFVDKREPNHKRDIF
jgi:hypothetical protein